MGTGSEMIGSNWATDFDMTGCEKALTAKEQAAQDP